MIHKIYVR